MTWRRLPIRTSIVAGAIAGIAGVAWFAAHEWRVRDSLQRQMGQYRVVEVHDGFFGLRCQPRQDIYFENTFLGSCATPGFLSDPDSPFPDPNCFVFAEDNSSVAYWHIPNYCGTSSTKAGGIYAHSAAAGERLVFSDKNIHQLFLGSAAGRGLQTGWVGPWDGPPGCRPILAVQADGVERPLKPNDPRCQ
jgi:hypothetical protein